MQQQKKCWCSLRCFSYKCFSVLLTALVAAAGAGVSFGIASWMVMAAYYSVDCIFEGNFETVSNSNEPLSPTSSLRLHHIQLVATHNSYHVRPAVPISGEYDYTHPTIVQQLNMGLRKFEFDLHWQGSNKGFAVYHHPIYDDRTICSCFADCINQAWEWSRLNRMHYPITFMLEPKNDLDRFVRRWSSNTYHELEEAIMQSWPKEYILFPDAVRGSQSSLLEAIVSTGGNAWPLVDQLRGYAVFVLLDRGEHLNRYLRFRPHLSGAVLFTAPAIPMGISLAPLSTAIDSGDSSLILSTAASLLANESAFFSLSKPEHSTVGVLVRAGFLVRTRCDSALVLDSDRRQMAISLGSHYLDTDFPSEWIQHFPTIFCNNITLSEPFTAQGTSCLRNQTLEPFSYDFNYSALADSSSSVSSFNFGGRSFEAWKILLVVGSLCTLLGLLASAAGLQGILFCWKHHCQPHVTKDVEMSVKSDLPK